VCVGQVILADSESLTEVRASSDDWYTLSSPPLPYNTDANYINYIHMLQRYAYLRDLHDHDNISVDANEWITENNQARVTEKAIKNTFWLVVKKMWAMDKCKNSCGGIY